MIQFSSRGYLYAPNRNTRPMCMNMRMMKTEAPQRCMPRTSQPAQRSFVMCCIDSYATGSLVTGSIVGSGL